jgi:hypothetical protein
MKRTSKRRLAGVATVVVVVAGAAAAVVTAGGRDTGPLRPVRWPARSLGPRQIAAASDYLGVSPLALAGDLQAGNSPADIANAIPGKSAAGLTATLVAARRQRLENLAATLTERLIALVDPGGSAPMLAGKRNRAASSGSLRPPSRLERIAAGYLGISPPRLQADLQSGQSLAQLAEATSGKSVVGLVATLVVARRERLAVEVVTDRLTAARAMLINAGLVRRVSAIVNGRLPNP